ncbi:MAG: DUF3863 domain-containing protein [Bacteroidia bacterium]|nr:DUF3863 domain-containing protein [Bacteroidia bacterium]
MKNKSKRFTILIAGALSACLFLLLSFISDDGKSENHLSKGAVLGNRFLTLNTVVRVNQIEVTRNRNEGEDEAAIHTLAYATAFREAIAAGWPEARITWAFSWQALFSVLPNYREIRDYAKQCHQKYGDDVTFIPGGYFANAYNTREQVNKDLHDALNRVSEFMGNGFRPKSVVAGFLAAENLQYLAETENIHVCQGNIWSQYAIDNQDGDGSICYPYYPSAEHFCKPAQSKSDFIDCVNLDGWTCDFLAARREGFKEGFNSRMGVGPIETVQNHGPVDGLKQMIATTAVHFDTGFSLNGFAWVTDCWEISLIKPIGHLECLTAWLQEIRTRWPDAKCITQGEFGLLWRKEFKNNDKIDYRFIQKGTGIGGSDKDKEISWFMNKNFRLAFLKDIKDNSEKVIDFTRYDVPAKEPQNISRNWSLMGEINQKQTRPQDAPLPLKRLSDKDREVIFREYPELSGR